MTTLRILDKSGHHHRYDIIKAPVLAYDAGAAPRDAHLLPACAPTAWRQQRLISIIGVTAPARLLPVKLIISSRNL